MLSLIGFAAGFFVGMWIFGYIFGFLMILGNTLNGNQRTNQSDTPDSKAADDQ